ncbi:alpha/beta fold hydrolase [Dyella tabacisoli]|uniref:Alpha/beta fold hydrolase n=1 Tax=Dyella tabacisoli TaxID=2282381 RepID=A0A369UJD4_9GAMM|nr:alpha/beta fold hydrolase [Dyella tabacisoli]RDD80235.1 alpha/beta fold hydrolase [Dyella tabacisoli]
MPYVTIQGQPLHYIDEGAGETVLLGHGYLWDATMWRSQISALSRHYRVIAPDLWGHGLSGALPAGTADIADLAQQMLALLDALAIEQCSVVGLSVGGMWGVELALAQPARIKRMVLMDTYLGAEPEISRARYFGMLAGLEQTGVMSPPLLDAIVPLFFASDGDPDSILRKDFREALAAMPAKTLRESVVPLGRIIFGRRDRQAELGKLDRDNILVMCGAKDIPRPPAEARETAAAIGCDYVLVPQAGHSANIENPSFVCGILQSFLNDGIYIK